MTTDFYRLKPRTYEANERHNWPREIRQTDLDRPLVATVNTADKSRPLKVIIRHIGLEITKTK